MYSKPFTMTPPPKDAVQSICALTLPEFRYHISGMRNGTGHVLSQESLHDAALLVWDSLFNARPGIHPERITDSVTGKYLWVRSGDGVWSDMAKLRRLMATAED